MRGLWQAGLAENGAWSPAGKILVLARIELQTGLL
jgi:hypothetical protein